MKLSKAKQKDLQEFAKAVDCEVIFCIEGVQVIRRGKTAVMPEEAVSAFLLGVLWADSNRETTCGT